MEAIFITPAEEEEILFLVFPLGNILSADWKSVYKVKRFLSSTLTLLYTHTYTHNDRIKHRTRLRRLFI